MTVDFAKLAPADVYRTMIEIVIPRPIAWVLSDNGDGSFNLAPFSFFSGVTSRPPILSISVGKKRDGSKKDTWRNIEERSRFVVHAAAVAHGDKVSATSASLAFGESEVTANGLELEPVEGWPLPRLKEARLAMWCELHRVVEVGDGPQGLILGEVRRIWVDDSVVTHSGGGRPKIDARSLDPLARLGGDDYAKLGEIFSIERPN